MMILFIRQFMDPYYQGFAAQIAFFIMLSLVPTVILVSQLLEMTGISLNGFIGGWVSKYELPPKMVEALTDLLGNDSSVGNNLVMIVMALWAASRAQFSLMRIANYTYTSGRDTGNFFKERWRSLKTMFLFIMTLAFEVVILVYGRNLLILFFGRVVESSMIMRLWAWLRWPLAIVLYFLVIMYEYAVLPIKRLTLHDIVPGTVFASVGMFLVTGFYAIYAGYIADYGLLYGSLSTIVALLFWFYFLSWVLVLGILFNKVWLDTRAK